MSLVVLVAVEFVLLTSVVLSLTIVAVVFAGVLPLVTGVVAVVFVVVLSLVIGAVAVVIVAALLAVCVIAVVFIVVLPLVIGVADVAAAGEESKHIKNALKSCIRLELDENALLFVGACVDNHCVDVWNVFCVVTVLLTGTSAVLVEEGEEETKTVDMNVVDTSL